MTNISLAPQADEQTQAPANPTYAYVGAFVDELQRAGVHHIVICPGSRSTPLTLACTKQHNLRVWMHVDERSAAFFGLGLAKRLHQPVALLCTSGTAAANFLPAIVEAHLTHVPLLVLTADRPHELRDNGAPQSIDQNHLYGTHVKWFVEVALPEATNVALRYIRTLADRATALTQALPSGPVHLNFPFREPLVPAVLADQPLPPIAQRDPIAWYGRPDNLPYVTVQETSHSTLSIEAITQLATQLETIQHGLFVVGPNDDAALAEPLLQLAERLGYPILADPLSQLRNDLHEQQRANIITSYDAFLRNTTFTERVAPELIVRIGPMPTSKPFLLYMKRYADCPLIVVDGQESWEDPTQLATTYIHTKPVDLCHTLLQKLSSTTKGYKKDEWLTLWQQTDQRTRQILEGNIRDFQQPFEGRVFTELNSLLPDGATLYVGNSMPVRDLDTFFWESEQRIHMLGNRGANGIDGIVSSALGASAAQPDRPTILVIGDLSFYHDLNGLLAARLHALNLTIVLINNDGGGIFSFLPQADYPAHFEQAFGTPTGLDFSLAVHMYGGSFQRTTTWEQFRKAVHQSMNEGGLHVVEVVTERVSNVSMHRQLWAALAEDEPKL